MQDLSANDLIEMETNPFLDENGILDEEAWNEFSTLMLESYYADKALQQTLIKDVFEQECRDLIIGPELAKRIIQYQLAFVNKNEDHVKFFGGHLTGVQVVRFVTTDRELWFENILGVEEEVLRHRLHALPTVHAERNVASDTFNISCAWLVHAILNARSIPDTLKHDAVVSTLLVLQYKFITSRLYIHFRFPADPAVAEAAYSSLSKKFALKQYGSWGVLLKARAESIVDHASIHYNTLMRMDNDVAVEYFLNDMKTRINDMLKNIVNVTFQAAAAGNKIVSVSSVLEHDGKEILRDRNKSLTVYLRYVSSIITDKNSFIRPELLVIIEKIILTMPPKLFRQTLIWMSENYRSARSTDIEEVVREIMIHCFDYLAHNRAATADSHDIPGLLVRLRGVYTSARSTDPVLLALRSKTETLVKLATGSNNVSLLPPVRTGIMLYIVLRALTMKHYVNSV